MRAIRCRAELSPAELPLAGSDELFGTAQLLLPLLLFISSVHLPARGLAWQAFQGAIQMINRYTIESLLELIDVRLQGEQGFRLCAEHARGAGLRRILARSARECAQSVRELRAVVRQLGGNPDERATIVTVARRGWVNLRAALAHDGDGAILDECERGESRILEAYRNALDDHLPDFVRQVVLRQFEAAMSNHDQIRTVCGQQPIPNDVAESGAQAGQH